MESTTEPKSLLQEVDARGSGGTLTIVGEDSETTASHQEILERSHDIAGALAQWGVEPGDRVAAVAHPSLDLVSEVLAIWRVGAAVVLLAPPQRIGSRASHRELINAMLEKSQVKVMLMDPRDAGVQDGTPELHLDQLPTSSSIELPGADPVAPGIIQFTSGTTGEPRGFVNSHRTLYRKFVQHREAKATKSPEDDRRLAWMPLHQWTLFSYVLYPMAMGASSVVLPTELYMRDPSRWILAMSRHRTTITTAPTSAYATATRHIAAGLSEPVDLSSLQSAGITGESIDPKTIEAFIEVAAPLGFDPNAIAPAYGLSETGAVSYTRLGRGWHTDHVSRDDLENARATPVDADDQRAARFVSSGSPYSNIEIRIGDDLGRALPERAIGQIMIRGSHFVDEYLNDPERIKSSFQDGWFLSGDKGYMTDDELYVIGRIKDTIIINGRNHNADDIERLLFNAGLAKDNACAAVSVKRGATEGFVVVAEVGRETDHDAWKESVKRAIWQELSISPREVVAVREGSLPRTSNGKIQRAAIKQSL